MYNYKAYITRVIDGDTIYARVDLGFDTCIEKLFRLEGINCPESRSKNLDEKQKGIAAKEYTKERIEKKEVMIESMKTEKYGRYLAVVTINGAILNEELVRKGHAKVYHGEKREGA